MGIIALQKRFVKRLFILLKKIFTSRGGWKGAALRGGELLRLLPLKRAAYTLRGANFTYISLTCK